MKYNRYIAVLLLVLLSITSCNRVNSVPEVKETYADGKPKVVMEYTTDEQGNKKLYKETHYFPGEKKYIEGKYDETQSRNGTWTSWYDNGQKNSEIKYVNGKEDGTYHVWHPNGKPYIKGHYGMGVKIGTWSFYDTLGKVVKETKFDKK